MKNPTFKPGGTPPRLFPTLIKGFNTIANHWYLMLFPIVVDLFLWLGPKFRLKTLLTPFTDFLAENLNKMSAPEMQPMAQAYQSFWSDILTHFNLASLLRTIPVGIPSLIARESPITTPLALSNNWIFEMTSTRWVFSLTGLLLLVGFLLGSVYFSLISHVTATEPQKTDFKTLAATYLQSLVMFFLLIVLLTIIAIPLMMLLSLLTLINLGIGQFFVLVAIIVLLWLLMPLVFSPHGVFVLKQKALPSMLISVRLVRVFLPSTGAFVITCVIISEGLNMLWSLPDATSWMTMIGIAGHAFVITSLLAASFLYYRDGLKWMQQNMQRMADAANAPQSNGEIPLDQY